MTRGVFTSDECEIVKTLLAGGVAVFPTDTVYGIGASVDAPSAIDRIYELKDRPKSKPIPILLDNPAQLHRFTDSARENAVRLAESYWPGTLTLIVEANDCVPTLCRDIRSTVALRVPGHDVLRKIIHESGGAIAATSANRSGEQETRSAVKAVASLVSLPDVALCGRVFGRHGPSTIVDCSGDDITILRVGAISEAEISAKVRELGLDV